MTPPCLFAEHAPGWMCITGPNYSTISSPSVHVEPDPVKVAAREVRQAAQLAARLEREALARELAAEAAAARKAQAAAMREERSRAAQAARAPKHTPEEMLAIRRANIAKAQAARLAACRAAPRREKPQPPAGSLNLRQAAAAAPCSPMTVDKYVKDGRLAATRIGRRVYVDLMALQICLARARLEKLEANLRNIAAVRAVRTEKRKTAAWATDPNRPRLIKRRSPAARAEE